jgi:alpha-tubulin suppressor-like RCC1 family protein
VLAADGALWTWGANDVGQLGDGKTTATFLPAKLTLGDVRALAAGWDHIVVLKNDGSLFAWGLNCFGQLGTQAGGAFSNVPVSVEPAVD